MRLATQNDQKLNETTSKMNKNYNRNFKASLRRLELVILLGKGFTYPIRKELKQEKIILQIPMIIVEENEIT